MRALSLPDNVPLSIRRELEGFLDAPSLEVLLTQLVERSVAVFESVDAIVRFDQGDGHCMYHSSKPLNADALSASEVVNYWLESGYDKAVQSELSSRYAAVSYSTFSWPFSGVSTLETPQGFAGFPRDYTIFIPISSRVTVRTALEQPFEGYLALFFGGFPDIADRFLELIVTLPELLSAICSAFLRQDARTSLDVMSYTQEMRNSLCTQKIYTLGSTSEDTSAYDDLIAQTNSMLLTLDDRLSKSTRHEQAIDLGQLVDRTLAVLPVDRVRPDLDIVRVYADNLPSVSVHSPSFITALQCVFCRICVAAKQGSALLIRTSRGEIDTAWLSISYSPFDTQSAKTCLDDLVSLHNGNSKSAASDCSGLALSKRIFSGHSGIVRVKCSEDGDAHVAFEFPFHED